MYNYTSKDIDLHRTIWLIVNDSPEEDLILAIGRYASARYLHIKTLTAPSATGKARRSARLISLQSYTMAYRYDPWKARLRPVGNVYGTGAD